MQSARGNQGGVRADRPPGDHHHFVTSLRPGRGVPTCVAPSFHASPKLRGSPRNSARQSARGRNPIPASRSAKPSTPRTLVAGVLEQVAAPPIQPGQHRPIPPTGVGATARIIAGAEVRTPSPPSHCHDTAAATRLSRIGHGWGDNLGHSSRLSARVEDVHAQRERDNAAVARPQGRSALPRRPHSSQHVQRPESRQRESPAPAHKMRGPASPYNIEQYIRMMWDTDRAAALASARRHQDPDLLERCVALTANAAATVPVSATARPAEAELVVDGVSAMAGVSRCFPAEKNDVYRLVCAPENEISQQLEQPQDRLQDQEKNSSCIADPASEQGVDVSSGFVSSPWREVVHSDIQPSSVAAGPRLSHFGAPAPTERQGSVKARGGAFGRFEMRKIAAVRRRHDAYSPIQGSMPTQAASGLVGRPHSPRARALAAVHPRHATPSIHTLDILEGVQTQLSLGNGTSSMQPTAESVAPVYSWRPIDSLKWIPGVVPARGPLLSPWPQPEQTFSPRAMNIVGIDSRPVTADAARHWTEELVKISRAPVIT